MSRSPSVLSALSLFLALSSCEPAGGDPEISDLKIKPDRAINRGDTLEISANANFDADFATATYKIMGPRGDASSYFHATSIFPRRLETSGGLSFRIVVDSVHPAFYDLTLTLTDAESYSNSKTVRFAIDYPPVAPRLLDSVTLGAQSHSAGSYLQLLDTATPTVWTKGNAASHAASIDVVFGADSSGTPSLMSPSSASAAGLTSDFRTRNGTRIVDLGRKLPGELTSAEAHPSSPFPETAPLMQGHTYFISNGIESKYLYASSLTGTDRSSSTLLRIYDFCCATGLLPTP